MAFPVPSHLPRGANQQDRSTRILSKISDTSYSEFSASLASSWIAELDDAIQQTKVMRSFEIKLWCGYATNLILG